VQVAQQSLQQLQAKHTQLKRDADYYNDPSVIESEARQQLGYVRSGEQAVIFVSTDQGGQQPIVEHKDTSQSQGYWLDWWHILFAS
jgi:hypothetical protein